MRILGETANRLIYLIDSLVRWSMIAVLCFLCQPGIMPNWSPRNYEGCVLRSMYVSSIGKIIRGIMALYFVCMLY